MSSSNEAALSRTLTRILRRKGIDPSIKCTSTLVASYNAEEDPKGREALRKWLEAYFAEFSQLRTGSISRNAIAEFANLAEIEVKEPADAELVRRVYTTLSEVVMTKEGCSLYFVLALEHVLSIVDNEILQQDARTLIALADRLIDLTNPKKMPLTRDMFEYHASCLHGFERALMVLHDLEKDRSDNHIVKYFEDKTKRHLDMIISCQQYYPLSYQALLIKEHLNALVKRDIKSNLINAGRRAFCAFCGGLYIFQGVRELAVMKLDFNVMVSGLEKIHQAVKDIGWDILPGVQEIVLAASETVEHDDFRIFQQCYDKFKKVTWLEGLKWNKQRAIRYALVSHLCLFCTEKHSASIQASASDLLVKLVTKDEGKQWKNDQQIFEALIDALIAIGKHNEEYEENVINAFDTIVRVQTAQQKKIIEKCLNGMSFEERIKSGYKSKDDDTSRYLFQFTRQKLSLHRTASTCNRNQQTLKNYYTTDRFAKVSLFSDKNDQLHIKTFDFNLVEYEEVVVFRNQEGQSAQDNNNQRENNNQRTMKVKKPITMKSLFEKHGTPTHGCHKDAQRLLIIGNPGTGKTCLSKRLCYDWATGSWGTRFTHVYLLPIRRLNETSVGVDADLPTIIRHLIYKITGTHDNNKALYEEINDNLSESTTLLILDGYDEAGEMTMESVTSAFTLKCSVLILSRPHGVDDIRPRVALEVECLEFTCKQLETFVHKQLKSCDANDLLNFFSHNLSIRDMCCVAVNAQIITRLWNSSYKEELIKSSCANLSNFYDMISKYLWTRFIDKEDKYDMNKTFDSLELIAYEAFQKGQVEIPEPLMLKHAQESRKVFCTSGFLLFVKEGSVFQFAHLTFHEYFAGRHLAKLLKSINDEERKKAKKFILEHKYIETSRVMLSFMTQCYCMRDDIEANLQAFKDLMQVLDSDPLPTISLQHLLLRMRALDAFLPCGLDVSQVVHTNDVVVKIVKNATDAFWTWFRNVFDDTEICDEICRNSYFRTSIVNELARMPNIFKQFPDLLKPILFFRFFEEYLDNEYQRDTARIGKLNPQSALQCILPMLNSAEDEERTSLIQLCAYIGSICVEPALDHLKMLCGRVDRWSQRNAIESLVAFIDLFAERDDVQQLMLDFSKASPGSYMFYEAIIRTNFTSKIEARAFVWDFLIEVIEDINSRSRGLALASCVSHYQTLGRPVEEVMELVREFANSFNEKERQAAGQAIGNLARKAPEKAEELFVMVKALCKDDELYVKWSAARSLLNLAKSSYLRRQHIFNMAFDMFRNGEPYVQFKLLPFLFSFDKKENRGIDEVNEWIVNCQDLDEEVRKNAISCSAANALLSKYTIEELEDKFCDQDKAVQVEIVRQFDLREMESNKDSCAITKMAVQCLHYQETIMHYLKVFEDSSRNLLKKISRKVLFSTIVLEKLAREDYDSSDLLRPQPLSHLLEYYWDTRNPNMTIYIAEKLLLSTVIFERKGESEMTVTFREKGASVKQTAPVEVVQDMLIQCKEYLKEQYGLDFSHD